MNLLHIFVFIFIFNILNFIIASLKFQFANKHSYNKMKLYKSVLMLIHML